jgi:hypothetical protein
MQISGNTQTRSTQTASFQRCGSQNHTAAAASPTGASFFNDSFSRPIDSPKMSCQSPQAEAPPQNPLQQLFGFLGQLPVVGGFFQALSQLMGLGQNAAQNGAQAQTQQPAAATQGQTAGAPAAQPGPLQGLGQAARGIAQSVPGLSVPFGIGQGIYNAVKDNPVVQAVGGVLEQIPVVGSVVKAVGSFFSGLFG